MNQPSQAEILDFSQPIATVQVRIMMLEAFGFDWRTLPTVQRWADYTDRYTLTYEDYCQLADELKQECKRAYRHWKRHEQK